MRSRLDFLTAWRVCRHSAAKGLPEVAKGCWRLMDQWASHEVKNRFQHHRLPSPKLVVDSVSPMSRCRLDDSWAEAGRSLTLVKWRPIFLSDTRALRGSQPLSPSTAQRKAWVSLRAPSESRNSGMSRGGRRSGPCLSPLQSLPRRHRWLRVSKPVKPRNWTLS